MNKYDYSINFHIIITRVLGNIFRRLAPTDGGAGGTWTYQGGEKCYPKPLAMHKGLILISVLIFMSLIMLLVTIGFTASELQWRMSNNQLQQAQVMQTAQFGLKVAYHKLQQHLGCCQISECSAYDLLIKPSSWWHSTKTCHGDFAGQNYYYVIEPLAIDNCLSINGSLAVKYWRITIRAEQTVKNGAAAMLQTTVSLPTKPTDKCQIPRHQLTSYVRSWRELR